MKGNNILELFFNNPTRQWHFEEIIREVHIARSKTTKWLKRFQSQNLIKRVKRKGKMPYYIGNYTDPSYRNKKKIFALNKLYDSGFLNHLYSLQRTQTVIIFGSIVRWDWHKGSDIDLFIYGDTEGLNLGRYEIRLHRDIQVFVCRNRKELGSLGEGLMKNIIKGDIVKGNLDFLEVNINA